MILTGRRLKIASGEADLPDWKVKQYRDDWAARGYDLPEWSPRGIVRHHNRRNVGAGVGTELEKLIGWIVNVDSGDKKGGCGSCKTLRNLLNRRPIEWSKKNTNWIVEQLVGRREQLADSLKIPRAVLGSVFGERACRLGAKGLVSLAIKNAEREPKRQRNARQKRRKIMPPAGSPTIASGPPPLTNPRLTLMFHCYPAFGWQYHAERLQAIIPAFDRLLLGVATDETTASVDEVRAAFGDRWEIFETDNVRGKTGLREVATYQLMLPTLAHETQDVCFCAHGKGAQQHTQDSDAVAWWIDAMYRTVLENRDGVIEALQTKWIAGSFRRPGRHLGTRHRWHYSGTYYAFRSMILSQGVPKYQQRWWGTESWPGDHFPLSASACLFGDDAGTLYKVDEQPRAEFEHWKAAHDTA